MAAVGSLLAAPSTALAADKLAGHQVDAGAISVSGISSGGYMAQQFHVAFSKEIMGAGIVAGGPYNCSESKAFFPPVMTAMDVCSYTIKDVMPTMPFLGPPDVANTIAATKAAATAGTIDPVDGLKADKVFLFSGENDTLVPQSVMDTLNTYYQSFLPAANIKYVNNIPAQHAFVTDGYGSACGYLGSPYINNCGYDTAGEILKFIYGNLNPPGDPAKGTLLPFDQTEFLPSDSISMAPTGHIFVPADCQTGAGCRLHVAFHGCLQDEQHIGDAFYTNAGYNRWAATNKIIVLYPQTTASFVPQNPNACWDWWGYTDSKYDTKLGKQMGVIAQMLDRLIGSK